MTCARKREQVVCVLDGLRECSFLLLRERSGDSEMILTKSWSMR